MINALRSLFAPKVRARMMIRGVVMDRRFAVEAASLAREERVLGGCGS
jgi:hypothetical protein